MTVDQNVKGETQYMTKSFYSFIRLQSNLIGKNYRRISRIQFTYILQIFGVLICLYDLNVETMGEVKKISFSHIILNHFGQKNNGGGD